MEKKVQEIMELENRLLCQLTASFEEVPLEVNGQLVDMAKDLADAEKNHWKACYYKCLVEEMKQEKEMGERYGYDNWRYSSGKFAPKGQGHRSGYPRIPEVFDPNQYDIPYPEMTQMPWGYRDGRNESSDSSSSRNNSGNSRMGFPMDKNMMMRPYDRFMESRKHYHETRDQNDRKEMDEHAKEHINEVVTTSREIFSDASPEMKKKMKQDLLSMVNAWQV